MWIGAHRNAFLFLAASALAAWPQDPTAGFGLYADTFKVQSPYNLPVASRFSDTGGMYTTKVFASDKPFEQGNPTDPRTEMRWDTWSDQSIEHMWEADVMYEPGTLHTCIMQVKSNTAGEAAYLRVVEGGDLILLNTGGTILKAYTGKWFNLKVAFNPKTSVSRIWVDDALKSTNHTVTSHDWYFKNGCYSSEGAGPSVAHFKNIKFRIWGAATSVITYPQMSQSSAAALLVFDLDGRLAAKARGRFARGVYLADPRRR